MNSAFIFSGRSPEGRSRREEGRGKKSEGRKTSIYYYKRGGSQESEISILRSKGYVDPFDSATIPFTVNLVGSSLLPLDAPPTELIDTPQP
jgi:hypothetical protein